jgi:hypothetical protein
MLVACIACTLKVRTFAKRGHERVPRTYVRRIYTHQIPFSKHGRAKLKGRDNFCRIVFKR